MYDILVEMMGASWDSCRSLSILTHDQFMSPLAMHLAGLSRHGFPRAQIGAVQESKRH